MRTKEAQRLSCSVFREAVVVGGSAGCFPVLTAILTPLSPDFALPVLVVQHLHPDDGGLFTQRLAAATRLPVREPCDKERIKRGYVYTAPANYHMLVERNGTIALSLEARVNWSRPSIDVLFESAALAWGEGVIAIIVSGASSDGAAGMRAIKANGGLTIAQEPATAEYPFMPQAAIDTGAVDEVLSPYEIGHRLVELDSRKRKNCRL